MENKPKQILSWEEAIPHVEKIAANLSTRYGEIIAAQLSGALTEANRLCQSPIEVEFYLAWAALQFEYATFGSDHGGKSQQLVLGGADSAMFDLYAQAPFSIASDGGEGVIQVDYLQTQRPVPPYRLDFAIRRLVRIHPDSLEFDESGVIAVECDGHDFHERTADQAARDKRRDRTIAADGYTVVRFTGRELHTNAAECAREVSALLDARIAAAVKARREREASR